MTFATSDRLVTALAPECVTLARPPFLTSVARLRFLTSPVSYTIRPRKPPGQPWMNPEPAIAPSGHRAGGWLLLHAASVKTGQRVARHLGVVRVRHMVQAEHRIHADRIPIRSSHWLTGSA